MWPTKEYYVKAGEIAKKVKADVSRWVKPGVRLVELAELIENRIRELGGMPAFPVNISVNEVAAHKTPLIDEELRIPEDSIVKVDIGVHVEGFIADTAVTLSFSDRYEDLIEANKEALSKAISTVSPGRKFSEIGSVVEKVARRSGFKVIKNLSGHSLGRYRIHAGEVIPNHRDPFTLGRFKTGRAYAIEPFLTLSSGRGYVTEVKGNVQIYALRRETAKGLTEEEAQLIEKIVTKFKTLPFCERWLRDVKPLGRLRKLLNSLVSKGILIAYPVLVEVSKSPVSQFEETVYITEEGEVIVTTA